MPSTIPLLSVRDLRAIYRSSSGREEVALHGLDLDLSRGEVLGVVGESGSGKSTLGLSIANLLRAPGEVVDGRVLFDGEDLLQADDARLRALRLTHIAVIFQDASAALNPLLTIGTQITEGQRAHSDIGPADAIQRSVGLLQAVGIPNAAARMHDYPHQMSGGMKQRLCIAIALSCDPAFLIADEPTTALDVTVQTQILDLLEAERASRGLTMMVISHDLGVIARLSNRIAVLYAGRIVEQGPAADVLRAPRHHYTNLLLKARPRIDEARMDRFVAIPGAPPASTAGLSGCAFADRCPAADAQCRTESPPRVVVGHDHEALCWHLVTGDEM
jgi:oligopeptide/dipeptide ABC transporter ATP-binding protein